MPRRRQVVVQIVQIAEYVVQFGRRRQQLVFVVFFLSLAVRRRCAATAARRLGLWLVAPAAATPTTSPPPPAAFALVAAPPLFAAPAARLAGLAAFRFGVGRQGGGLFIEQQVPLAFEVVIQDRAVFFFFDQ